MRLVAISALVVLALTTTHARAQQIDDEQCASVNHHDPDVVKKLKSIRDERSALDCNTTTDSQKRERCSALLSERGRICSLEYGYPMDDVGPSDPQPTKTQPGPRGCSCDLTTSHGDGTACLAFTLLILARRRSVPSVRLSSSRLRRRPRWPPRCGSRRTSV